VGHDLTRALHYKKALLVSTAASTPLARRFWRIIVNGKLARFKRARGKLKGLLSFFVCAPNVTGMSVVSS
jgi:hypothetical protein